MGDSSTIFTAPLCAMPNDLLLGTEFISNTSTESRNLDLLFTKYHPVLKSTVEPKTKMLKFIVDGDTGTCGGQKLQKRIRAGIETRKDIVHRPGRFGDIPGLLVELIC